MSLKDAFEEEANKPHLCALTVRTRDLSTEDREVLQNYLEDDATPNAAIGRALKRIGVVVSNDMIRQHRSQICRCYR